MRKNSSDMFVKCVLQYIIKWYCLVSANECLFEYTVFQLSTYSLEVKGVNMSENYNNYLLTESQVFTGNPQAETSPY